MFDGLLALAEYVQRHALVIKRVTFAPLVADLAPNEHSLLVVLDGAARLAQGGVGVAQVGEHSAFVVPVADLTVNG